MGGPKFTWRLPILTGYNQIVYLARLNLNADTGEWVKTINDFQKISIEITRDWDSEENNATSPDGNDYT